MQRKIWNKGFYNETKHKKGILNFLEMHYVARTVVSLSCESKSIPSQLFYNHVDRMLDIDFLSLFLHFLYVYRMNSFEHLE